VRVSWRKAVFEYGLIIILFGLDSGDVNARSTPLSGPTINMPIDTAEYYYPD